MNMQKGHQSCSRLTELQPNSLFTPSEQTYATKTAGHINGQGDSTNCTIELQGTGAQAFFIIGLAMEMRPQKLLITLCKIEIKTSYNSR